MRDSIIVEIDNFLVSSEILTERFSCNYQECGGACCVIGDSGAPLEEEEVPMLKNNYREYREYMVPKGVEEIKRQGFAVKDQDGDLVTPLVGTAECAYAFFEEGGCLCAIERACSLGKCTFKKPISCRLYPIRVTKLSSGMTALNLHRWSLCRGAFAKGKREGIPVYQFLKAPLIDAFGQDLYNALEAAAAQL